jgi:predicted nucleic acid-binding protein
MRSVYIEASALFKAYKEEPGSEVVDYLYGLMESKKIIGLTSQLSVPEILRGIVRRKNRGEIPDDEAQKVIASILLDVDKRVLTNELRLLPVNEEQISLVNRCIRFHNFYVIDAIQFVTAYAVKPTAFVHADEHFSSAVVEEQLKALDVRDEPALAELKVLLEGEVRH